MNDNYKRTDFDKSVSNLALILAEPETAIVRDAAIKRFELCYELAWKSIQEACRAEGLEVCKSPKSCFKQAFQQDWIEDERAFLEMIQKRHLTAHTYNENFAREIYTRLKQYPSAFKSLLEK